MTTTQQLEIIQSTFEQSNEGKLYFGEVIQQLVLANVETYFVDYRTGKSIYYLASGDTTQQVSPPQSELIGQHFDAHQIKQAILGAQSGRVMYPEFKKLSTQAGCIGYFVWIKGKKVDYLGCCGEVHTEYFPQ